MRRWLGWMVLAGYLAAASGCRNLQSSGAGSAQATYDFENYPLHPEIRLYHHREDSSTLFVGIPSRELLYTRENGGNLFKAHAEVRVIASEPDLNRTDTILVERHDYRRPDERALLLAEVKIPAARGRWRVFIRVTDLHRGAYQDLVMQFEKTDRPGPHDLLFRSRDGRVLLSPYVRSGEPLTVGSDRHPSHIRESLTVLHWAEPFKLPPPPFSSGEPEFPNAAAARQLALQDTGGQWVFTPESGSYFCALDSAGGPGWMIHCTESGNPEIQLLDQLAGPLRYITSRAEYDEIIHDAFPKQVIDRFWEECGGSRDRARELIRIYYGRVEEANRYFTSFAEGWRTDRGMIHIVFGNPGRINRTEYGETWFYGEEGAPGSVSFLFRKKESPFSDNVYVLQRDPMFRQSWEQMVTSWRQARVFNE